MVKDHLIFTVDKCQTASSQLLSAINPDKTKTSVVKQLSYSDSKMMDRKSIF